MRALYAYEHCCLCGRKCGVNRNRGETGFCGSSPQLRIAWAGLHYGEEPVISGTGGSGTVFLAGCTLKCFFCQNHQLSSEALGRDVSLREFEDICLMLQRKGAHNINLVTGTQFIPSLAEGIKNARKRRLHVPVVWNSSGYESENSLPLLDEFVDIYLPDLKTLDSGLSTGIFGLSDYVLDAPQAIKKMAASRPLHYSDNDETILSSGVIVRHLVLPGLIDNTRTVLEWFASNMAGKALLSVMVQYTPTGRKNPHPVRGDWSRSITAAEYEIVLALLEDLDIVDGFVQELPEENLLPDFSRRNTFPHQLAEPFWFCGDF